MTIDKEKLKALAETATQSHGPRRVEVDHNGRNVIGDGSWKILSAWHTPDGKGAQNAEFAAAASPATILALLAEIERLAKFEDWFVRLDQVEQSLSASFKAERDQLKAENEALRKDAERYRWLRDKQTFIWLIQDWFPGEAMLTNVDADIDAAMAKEAK